MDNRNYGEHRWTIVYGSYEGLEKYAVDELYKVVNQYTPYILTVHDASTPDSVLQNYHLVIIGTKQTNALIQRLCSKGTFQCPIKEEGYRMLAEPSMLNPEKQMIVLAGTDLRGVLYAVRDFEHDYCTKATYQENFDVNPYQPFVQKMPECNIESAPSVLHRGLWTWGHVIHDYRRYFDHMSRWKLNTVIIWNDIAPLNAKDVVEYAHSRGIRIIWGFTWCWGEQVDVNDQTMLESWYHRVLETYETQYASLGADGIYFQAFTETDETQIGGIGIAESVTRWVNEIGGRLLCRYKDLVIQFGLHATSVKDAWQVMAGVDKRIDILWEDAGSFPFAYFPDRIDTFPETYEFVSKICALRGAEERFGMVFKGMSLLSWPNFEHQKGSFILGEAARKWMIRRADEKRTIWKYSQAYWLAHVDLLKKLVRLAAEQDIQSLTITALAEDGMFEEKMWCPVALYAETLWNPYEDEDALRVRMSLAEDVTFA